MRILNDESDKKLDNISIFLTKEEAIQLRGYLNQLLDDPKLHHAHLSSKDYQKEIGSDDIKSLLGLIEIDIVSKFVDFLYEKNMAEAINYLNAINNKGLDLEEFTKGLINYLRKVLVSKIIGEESSGQYLINLTKEEVKHLQQQAENFTNEELRNILSIFLEAQNKMKYSPIPQLPLELGIVEICGIV